MLLDITQFGWKVAGDKLTVDWEAPENISNIREWIFSCMVVLARRAVRQNVAPAVKLAEHVDLDVLAAIVRIALYVPVVKK